MKLAWKNSWNHIKKAYFWRFLAIWNPCPCGPVCCLWPALRGGDCWATSSSMVSVLQITFWRIPVFFQLHASIQIRVTMCNDFGGSGTICMDDQSHIWMMPKFKYFCSLKYKFILKQNPIRIKTWFDASTAFIYVLFPLLKQEYF